MPKRYTHKKQKSTTRNKQTNKNNSVISFLTVAPNIPISNATAIYFQSLSVWQRIDTLKDTGQMKH